VEDWQSIATALFARHGTSIISLHSGSDGAAVVTGADPDATRADTNCDSRIAPVAIITITITITADLNVKLRDLNLMKADRCRADHGGGDCATSCGRQ
jgi:hypothetical protein